MHLQAICLIASVYDSKTICECVLVSDMYVIMGEYGIWFLVITLCLEG